MSWYQVIIEDSDALSGKSILKILRVITQNSIVEYVYVSIVEGAMIQSLFPFVNKFTNSRDVLNAVKSVTQIDWADFFFYNNVPDSEPSQKESYPSSIGKSDLLLRCVDDTYFYVYTKNKFLVEELQSEYSNASVTKGELEYFEYPE